MPRVELIVTGNEVLSGDVLDTNSHWLCQRITGLGARVERITTVRDDLDAIAEAVQSAGSRQAALIVTIGGLGPTADDLTVEAIARATALSLELDPQAEALVAARYRELASEGAVADAAMTPARQKMALVPRGARVYDNPVGAAPPLALDYQGATIVTLPGVPREMRAIVEGPLVALLAELLGQGYYSERLVIADANDESVLSPLLLQVADRHKQVYVKSHARRFGPEVTFRITLSLAGSAKALVDEDLAAAVQDLKATLQAAGITTKDADPEPLPHQMQ
jgi:nicotinamide-nucleotide amidase